MEDYEIHDISDKELKIGYWLISRKEQFKKAMAALIGLIALAFWAPSIIGWAVYLNQLPQDQEIIQSLTRSVIDFEAWHSRVKPKELQLTQAQVIYSGSDKYDFVASAYNPNLNRGVKRLEFRFISGDFMTPVSSIVILPGQKVYLMSLGNQSDRRLTSAELEIVSAKWQGLRERLPIENPKIEISNIRYSSLGNNARAVLRFTAVNQTLYNYWQGVFQAVLFNNNRIVGVNQFYAEEFMALEERDLEISWFESLPSVGQTEVVPVFYFYNVDNYFVIPGQATEL